MYIEHVKSKFNVNTKTDLIDKAYSLYAHKVILRRLLDFDISLVL